MPENIRKRCYVLDFDKKWDSDRGFVFYDFNAPETFDEKLRGTFSMVLIDPPFITKEVWEKYAATARLLLRPNGKLICTTIAENEGMMKELLDVTPCVFQPSIPNLVYQYLTYTNYESPRLAERNPDVPE